MSETIEIAGAISQYLFDQLCQDIDGMKVSADGDTYRHISTDELPDGDPGKDDPDLLILRRDRDGALFDFEIDPWVTRYRPNPPVTEIPGQLAIGGAS